MKPAPTQTAPPSTQRQKAVIGASLILAGLLLCRSLAAPAASPVATDSHSRAIADFGAYYSSLNTGADWEAYSRTGPFADIVVRLPDVGGQLVFWRGNSYLPYWKTGQGQWNLTEIVSRRGDGTQSMPDRVNAYSHAEIIESTPSVVRVHWRYCPTFTGDNPNGGVSPDDFVEELFTITPGGRVQREVRQGTERFDDWMDPLNRTRQVLQLGEHGVVQVSLEGSKHSVVTKAVKGAPVKKAGPVAPVFWFTFDEGQGDEAQEAITKSWAPVAGQKTFWKRGVSGTALEFDGYNTAVAVPAAKAPALSGGSLTLEGWFALGAYPWNWAPIVQQGDNDGYFLGVDSHGYPGFMVKVDGVWQELGVSNQPPYTDANHLALFRWYHAVGTYNKGDGMMRLYIDGREIASRSIGRGGLQTVLADVKVGKAGVRRVPTEAIHDTHPSEFGIDGLIDEVKIYNVALTGSEVSQSYANDNPGPAFISAPDMQRRHFPVPATAGKFGAVYTHLPYYETWDDLWRFGDYADVVVGFDGSPAHFVFWRGVSYVPMMVNEANQWFTEEFNETGWTTTAPGDNEPMSDKACWDSHVRVIENNGARVVVHWRYRLENPDHHWANYDANGWGDIADWYYYIYPDGVAAKIMRCYSSAPEAWHEWDEQITVLSEGQHPESVLGKSPVMTLVDLSGKATNYDWNPNPPKPQYQGQVIQKIWLTGQYDPFAIQNFDDGDVILTERTWYSVFPTWNHWPTAQVNSSGRNASFPDRAAHCSTSHFFLPLSSEQRGKVPFQEKILMEGMTSQPAASLAGLARSWLSAPPVTQVSGGTSQGYHQSRRAYAFSWAQTPPLRFQIAADAFHPIHHLCFEVKNWPGRMAKAQLEINHVTQAAGPDFRQGVNLDSDGTYTLIVWVGLSATTSQEFVIAATPRSVISPSVR